MMKKETKAERDARYERTLANAARTRALAEKGQAELDKRKERES
jgi:DNA-directed RNA polymerase subunit K/omega